MARGLEARTIASALPNRVDSHSRLPGLGVPGVQMSVFVESARVMQNIPSHPNLLRAPYYISACCWLIAANARTRGGVEKRVT